MIKSHENKEISQEYANFLNHYQDFLKYYNHCYELMGILKSRLSKTNTHILSLFEEALQAHINATNAYKKAIQAHQKLTQKVLTYFIKRID